MATRATARRANPLKKSERPVLREVSRPAHPARSVSPSFVPPEPKSTSGDDEATRFTHRLSPTVARRRISQAALDAAAARQAGRRLDEDVDDDEDVDVGDGGAVEQLPSAQELEHLVDADERDDEDRDETAIADVAAAPVPMAAAAPVAATVPGPTPQPTGPTLAPITITDGDALWDWIRQDADRGAEFFGSPVATSLDLHMRLSQLRAAEADWRAVVRAIHVGTSLVGFAQLNPIVVADGLGVLTVYLAPALRGQFAQALPSIVQAMAAETPLRLALPAPSAEWADLYRHALTPLGFVEHRLFVR